MRNLKRIRRVLPSSHDGELLAIRQPFFVIPLHNPDADAALFDALERTVVQTDERRLIRLPFHINDAEFAQALVENWDEIAA